MAKRTPARPRSNKTGWIIGGIILALLLLFVFFGFGDRTPTDGRLDTVPAIDDPGAEPVYETEPGPDPVPQTAE